MKLIPIELWTIKKGELGQVKRLHWHARASTTRRKGTSAWRGENCNSYTSVSASIHCCHRTSIALESRLEGENEKATHNEEGNGRHAGVDGGSSTGRVRCLTSRVRVGSAVDVLGESGERSVVAVRRLIGIDSEDHALAAVVRLPAVHPDWINVVDGDVIGREGSGRRVDGYEARIETFLAGGGDKLELAARSTEGGLCNGVVLRSELKNDGVAWCSFD